MDDFFGPGLNSQAEIIIEYDSLSSAVENTPLSSELYAELTYYEAMANQYPPT